MAHIRELNASNMALSSTITDFASLAIMRIASRVRPGSLPVLTFHRVSDVDNGLWPDLPSRLFAELIENIVKYFTPIIPMQESTASRRNGKPPICVTFDDGYMFFRHNVLPILQRHGVPAICNINPGLIDRNSLSWPQLLNIYLCHNAGRTVIGPSGNPVAVPAPPDARFFIKMMYDGFALNYEALAAYREHLASEVGDMGKDQLMGWNEIRACADAGIVIGNHTLTHPNLQTTHDPAILDREISFASERIEEELGFRPFVFAFPNGLARDDLFASVAGSKHRVALLCNGKMAKREGQAVADLTLFETINMGAGPLWKERLRLSGFARQ